MNKNEEFIDLKDLDSIQRALTNAEIDFEITTEGDIIDYKTVLVTENGLKFYFDNNSQLTDLINFE